jgi:hypothetical protein
MLIDLRAKSVPDFADNRAFASDPRMAANQSADLRDSA